MTESLITTDRSMLVLIDFQAKLMPHIADGAAALANAKRLVAAAQLLNVSAIVTEQNAKGIGATMPELGVGAHPTIHKKTFGACATPAFIAAIGTSPDFVVAGCEAHVCVLQTVLGLLDLGRRVFVVRDASGSRRAESKDTALARMASHGAHIVTTEMVIFEWLGSSDHPKFKECMGFVK
jgi:nicotinamidase-related amidase